MIKPTVIITGSLGLIGYETALLYLSKGYSVVGIDNDMRARMLHITTQYKTKLDYLRKNHPGYLHYRTDITNQAKINEIFIRHRAAACVIHTAAQTSHDWSASHPETDFRINALGTCHLLRATKEYIPRAVFIFTSTNKVYGDAVNALPFETLGTRLDLPKQNTFHKGIPETFTVDRSIHSPFGVSKLSADLMVQEYGRYYGLRTGVFRLGVVTGGGQSGALDQGFLAYFIGLIKAGKPITVIGYGGRQVRDIIHAKDVASAFWHFYRKPAGAAVYNMGGGRTNNASIREIIALIDKKFGSKTRTSLESKARTGDHKWWITDTSLFQSDYPRWQQAHTLPGILEDLYNAS